MKKALSVFIFLLTTQFVHAEDRKQIIFLLPEHFSGWVCVDTAIAGAPPLPREGETLIIRPVKGEILKTSDKIDHSYFSGKAFYEVAGERRHPPDGVYAQKQISSSDSKTQAGRYCSFFGTEDEADAADDPPGFERSPQEAHGISHDERLALIALYRATNGPQWKHHVGWMNQPGTECKWHGVMCTTLSGKPRTVCHGTECTVSREDMMTVYALYLNDNELTGTLPSELGKLSHLESFGLFGNHLSGRLPDSMIHRWLAGSLDIHAEASLLTTISEIDHESSASAILCASTRTIIRSDNSVVSYTERCRNATPDDRTTFCEMKPGHTWATGYAKLGLLIEKNGFFNLRTKYFRNVSDAGFENTRVTRNGKAYAVSNYADAGPLELWTIQRAIEGVAASAEWEKTTTQPECPRWTKEQE